MSVAERIEEINDGLLAAYASVETKGGTVPSEKNLDNLPTAIESISGGGDADPYITFSTDSGTNELTTSQRGSNVNLEYSYDTNTWTTWDLTTPLEFGGSTKLYLRGTNNGLNGTKFAFSSNTPLVDCTGRIARLLSYNGFCDYTCPSSYCFSSLFNGCKALRTAPELTFMILMNNCYSSMFYGCTSLTTAPELPATRIRDNCYESMFYNCSSLTTAPELPATTLFGGCYKNMFSGCTSLTTAPELPATTLSASCYNSMFYNCSSLTAAPGLPATTLASECYVYMFSRCSSLTTAPELPATTLLNRCYYQMFYLCSQLSFIKCLATDISASSCVVAWTFNVSSTGTFVKAAGVEWPSGQNGIPTGWTVEEV